MSCKTKYLPTWKDFFFIGIVPNLRDLANRPEPSGFGQSFIQNPQWIKVAGGLNFPEGPAWNGKDALLVSNCYGGWIAQITDSKVDTFATIQSTGIQKTNGTAFDRYGNLFVCDFGLKAILKISPEKSMTVVANSCQNQPFNRPNDLAFAKNGNLYFTDPNQYDRQHPDGKVYCVSGKDPDYSGFGLFMTRSHFPTVLHFQKTINKCSSVNRRRTASFYLTFYKTETSPTAARSSNFPAVIRTELRWMFMEIYTSHILAAAPFISFLPTEKSCRKYRLPAKSPAISNSAEKT